MNAARDALTDPLVRAGLTFGLGAAALVLAAAAPFALWRWRRTA